MSDAATPNLPSREPRHEGALDIAEGERGFAVTRPTQNLLDKPQPVAISCEPGAVEAV
jgi:hypothetical protein